MRCSLPALLGIATALVASHALAQGAGGAPLSIGVAEKMAAACVAYASAHQGAVNIWVFDRTGGLVHFQRMDGAPRTGPQLGGGLGLGDGLGGPSEGRDGVPSPNGPGSVPVNMNGRPAGTVRVDGMGPFSDRACAQAAAAAVMPARDQRPQP